MELGIHLDLEEAGAADLPRIEQEFQAWCVATGVGSPKSLPSLHALRVDMGGRDCITALMDLHSRLYHYKAKIFIQFIHGPIG